MTSHAGQGAGMDRVAAAALALRGRAGGRAQKTQLLVYTALETDQLKAYEEGFNEG